MNHPMRRNDRALSEQEAYAVLQRCDVCRLAFSAEPVPYILPMNFGLEQQAGETVLYFHCAPEGRKLSLLLQSPAVGFEADHSLALIRAAQPCGWGMAYESVIGEGILSLVENLGEKRRGLSALMRHYSEQQEFSFPDEMVTRTTVLKLSITSISGKSRPLPAAPL